MASRHSSMPFRSRPGFYPDVTIVLLLVISHTSAFVTRSALAAISSSARCKNKGTTASYSSTFCVVGTSSQLLDCWHDGRRIMNTAGLHSRLLASTQSNDDGGSSKISSNDSDNNSSSAEPDTSTWANAELPLSNDQQVTQATAAVWKVSKRRRERRTSARYTMLLYRGCS